ncbi:MAG TPA: N-acetylneuraminate synthase family protein [Candidatus Omnitrophota bacterium]|nr:N-acetylneuraminate synthase family protein [Candidatus Omnitrophota bacterium]
MIIIAEIGINHNGSLGLAHELIRQAKISGADIAKFQFYDPDKIFGPKGSYPDKKNYEFALSVQFNFTQAKTLKEYCDEEGIEFMASVFDLERFDWMEKLKARRYKIASRAVENTELCRKILRTKKEAFISLGFWKARAVPYKDKNARYLYCVPKYPCDYQDLRLPKDFSKGIYQGFSDHSIGIEASLMAAARGARIIEKHFTLNKGLAGPDHICSMTPDELCILSEYTRLMEKIE